MSETDDRVIKLFTKGSHHRNLSVTYIVKKTSLEKKAQRTISLNSYYILLSKNPRDAAQIMQF